MQIGSVAGKCGHNVADVRFWVAAGCMEGNRVRDGVSRYSLLIWVAKCHLGGPGLSWTCKQLGRCLSPNLDFWYAKRETVRQRKYENFNGYWMRYMSNKLENVRKDVLDE